MCPRSVSLLVIAILLATLPANGGWTEELRLDDSQLGQVTVENEAAALLAEQRESDCFGRGDHVGAFTGCYPANLPDLADRNPLIGYRAILKATDELPSNDR